MGCFWRAGGWLSGLATKSDRSDVLSGPYLRQTSSSITSNNVRFRLEADAKNVLLGDGKTPFTAIDTKTSKGAQIALGDYPRLRVISRSRR